MRVGSSPLGPLRLSSVDKVPFDAVSFAYVSVADEPVVRASTEIDVVHATRLTGIRHEYFDSLAS